MLPLGTRAAQPRWFGIPSPPLPLLTLPPPRASVRSVSLAGWASVSPSQCPFCGRGRSLCLRLDAGGNLVVQNELRLKTSEPGMYGSGCDGRAVHTYIIIRDVFVIMVRVLCISGCS